MTPRLHGESRTRLQLGSLHHATLHVNFSIYSSLNPINPQTPNIDGVNKKKKRKKHIKSTEYPTGAVVGGQAREMV